jgi:two-component system, NarL family, nitrate/nitrite response regulator NarL
VDASVHPVIKVLLVDDHESILWGLQKLIDGENQRMQVVGIATNSRDALEIARTQQPDVVLLDLDLGEEKGLDLVAPLGAQFGAKVIILTGLRDTAVHESAVMRGACGLIHKSERAEVILKAISHVHAGELWLDRATTARVFASLSRQGDRDIFTSQNPALTGRERWVVQAVVKHGGAPAKVIADALHISGHTLRNHLTSIYGKLGVHRRLDLVLYAMEHGLDKPV